MAGFWIFPRQIQRAHLCHAILQCNKNKQKADVMHGCDVSLPSEHHAVQTVFHELLVKSHELGDKGFQVVDGFAAQLQPMLIIGCHVCHLCLQLAVAVLQQLCD